MKYKLILIALLFSCHMAAQPLCIPTVQEAKPAQGSASFSQFSLIAYDNASLQPVADYLSQTWAASTLPSSLQKKGSANAIFLSLPQTAPRRIFSQPGASMRISSPR